MTGITCSMLGISPAATGRTALTVTAIGNAQVDTAQSKFGGACLLLDGAGDYIQTTESIGFGTGNFTIEGWFRRDDVVTAHILFEFRTTEPQVAGTLYADNQTLIWYVNGGARITSGNVLSSTTAFYHIAVARSGTSTKLFVDGTQVGSTYTDSNNYISTRLRIGAAPSTGSSDYDGWIDEIRVSNVARYTANFTAPTAAFTNDSDTLLLIHCDGTDASTTFTDDNA